MVHAEMLGQHGAHLVPIWSRIRARGVGEQQLADVIGQARDGRVLAELPDEIRHARSRTLTQIREGDIAGAYDFIGRQPADIRAAVKPFFTHFTAGRTTELATAHAVVDVVEFMAQGLRAAIPAQVMLEGEWNGIGGPLAVPVLIDPRGWSQVVEEPLADDEATALHAAAEAIARAAGGG